MASPHTLPFLINAHISLHKKLIILCLDPHIEVIPHKFKHLHECRITSVSVTGLVGCTVSLLTGDSGAAGAEDTPEVSLTALALNSSHVQREGQELDPCESLRRAPVFSVCLHASHWASSTVFLSVSPRVSV